MRLFTENIQVFDSVHKHMSNIERFKIYNNVQQIMYNAYFTLILVHGFFF